MMDEIVWPHVPELKTPPLREKKCCCNWGAAVKGEWPEFECFKCPKHGGNLSTNTPKDMCKRHRKESEQHV